jgi:hypothetical protein
VNRSTLPQRLLTATFLYAATRTFMPLAINELTLGNNRAD